MYDKNVLVNLVINMFLIYQGINKQQIIEEFDFKLVKASQLEILATDKLRKLDQILKVNKKINVDAILKINRALGMLFSIMEIAIRQYFSHYAVPKTWKELLPLWTKTSKNSTVCRNSPTMLLKLIPLYDDIIFMSK